MYSEAWLIKIWKTFFFFNPFYYPNKHIIQVHIDETSDCLTFTYLLCVPEQTFNFIFFLFKSMIEFWEE